MAAAAGILNSSTSAAEALSGTTVKADSDSSSTTTSSDSVTISSSDFLTLLVTELKNQDPTASTDPNEYVNQLVAVNSLEQLIDINTTLTEDLSTTTTTSSASKSKTAVADSTTSSATAQSNTSSSGTSISSALQTATSKLAPGNLSVPATNASAQVVAHALSGQRKTL
jgi:flagellar basal-body rod modification protein FlgD